MALHADWKWTTSGAAIAKAGANYTSTENTFTGFSGAAYWDDLFSGARGNIEANTRRSWDDNFEGLPEGIKYILGDVASSIIGKELINRDQTGYFFGEAQTMLNVQDDKIGRGLRILNDFKSNELRTP